MILLRKSRRQGRHSEVILSSPPALLRPSLHGLWPLPVVFGAMQFPKRRAQLAVLPTEGAEDPASCKHLEHPQVCLPKERGSIR